MKKASILWSLRDVETLFNKIEEVESDLMSRGFVLSHARAGARTNYSEGKYSIKKLSETDDLAKTISEIKSSDVVILITNSDSAYLKSLYDIAISLNKEMFVLTDERPRWISVGKNSVFYSHDNRLMADEIHKKLATHFVALDFGSLKLKTTVFEAKKNEAVEKYSHLTLLGKDIDINHRLHDDSVATTKNALEQIRLDLQKFELPYIKAIGTEALRKAANRDLVVLLVRSIFAYVELEIVKQETEGVLFRNAVTGVIPPELPITIIDIGGSSTQIHQRANKGVWITKNLDFGAYTLQQKYSKDDTVVSPLFNELMYEIEEGLNKVDLIKTEHLVIGSSCMKDFYQSALNHLGRIPRTGHFENHEISVSPFDIEAVQQYLQSKSPDSRSELYPNGGYFVYGADILQAILLQIINKTSSINITPTNLNSSSGLFANA